MANPPPATRRGDPDASGEPAAAPAKPGRGRWSANEDHTFGTIYGKRARLPIAEDREGESFKCPTFHCVLTRTDCVNRHVMGKKYAGTYNKKYESCRICGIGMKHEAGKPTPPAYRIRRKDAPKPPTSTDGER